jgi:hypothetical protein
VGPGPTGRVGPGETREVTVTNIGGVPLQGVSAVVLNVTAVGSSASTFITAWPTGQGRPNASNLNVPPGDTRPNLVTVQVGAGGRVSFYNDAGTVDLLADVSGYYSASATRRYNPVSPTRIWDTRVGPGPVGRIGANQIVPRQVIGQGGGVPGEGVSAVVLNVTAVNATADTYLTVWPATETKPEASNLNLPPGDTRPNLVIVKTVDGEHNPADNGVVNFYNFAGNVDLVVDIAGYFIGSGDRFHSVAPGRVWDTRVGPGPVGRVGGPDQRDVTVTGSFGVPTSGVTAVVLNVTSVNPTAPTYVTAWPTGEVRPNASNLNIPPGDTRANLVIVKVGAGGKVSFFNELGTNDLIADIAGWFGPT